MGRPGQENVLFANKKNQRNCGNSLTSTYFFGEFSFYYVDIVTIVTHQAPVVSTAANNRRPRSANIRTCAPGQLDPHHRPARPTRPRRRIGGPWRGYRQRPHRHHPKHPAQRPQNAPGRGSHRQQRLQLRLPQQRLQLRAIARRLIPQRPHQPTARGWQPHARHPSPGCARRDRPNPACHRHRRIRPHRHPPKPPPRPPQPTPQRNNQRKKLRLLQKPARHDRRQPRHNPPQPPHHFRSDLSQARDGGNRNHQLVLSTRRAAASKISSARPSRRSARRPGSG